MTDDISSKNIDSITNELREEFIDATKDQLINLDDNFAELHEGKISTKELTMAIKRAVIPISGQASGYDMHHLAAISLRLEDFLANGKNASHNNSYASDCQVFIDIMMDMLEGNLSHDNDLAALVRQLPIRSSFNLEDVEIRNIEVMLVMLPDTSAHFVEREMHACGYRTSTITNTFDALAQIVQTQPDMVIISAMMPYLNGIDLVIALDNMPSTRNIPCALITSLEKGDSRLQFLPASMPIINKGKSFSDDLVSALSSSFLL